ncbi:MAG: ABC transporter substrate-binding protein [Thaumarchaeota archaeon]|nr:ABC transporter substrate-binding protein [Nitrososphaerota archaeon]
MPLRPTVLPLILLTLLISSIFICTVAAEQPIKIIDDFGRIVSIPKKPMRIVSLAPSFTETLFALGLGDRVVGVTSYCNYPPEVLEKVGRGEITVVGGYTTPSLEEIVALEPDLVIGHNHLPPDIVMKLEELGIPIILINTSRSIEELYEDIKLIGKACWVEDEAAQLIKTLKDRIAFWEERLKDIRRVDVAEIAWVNPLFIAGNDTYISDIIWHAGGRNVFSDKQGWAQVSDEELVKRDPSHIIVPYRHGVELIYDGIMEMKKRGLIHGEIHPIDPDILSRPGPRVAILFEEVVKAIHPEIWERAVKVEQIIAPSRAVVGDLLTIFVLARNPGLVAGEKIVELSINGEIFSQKVLLRPGEARLLNFTFVVKEVGEYVVKAGGQSVVIKVSPTSEEIMSRARESFEKSLQEYLSPMSSRIEVLAGELNNLKERIKELDVNSTSLSESIVELRGELEYLRNMAVTSAIISGIAIAATAALILYIVPRMRKAKT